MSRRKSCLLGALDFVIAVALPIEAKVSTRAFSTGRGEISDDLLSLLERAPALRVA